VAVVISHCWLLPPKCHVPRSPAAWRSGSGEATGRIFKALEDLAGFYPEHIRKEDKVFFPAAMNYFSAGENEWILAEMFEFDRKLIHEHYRAVVARFELPEGN